MPRSVLLVLASSGWGGTEKAFVDLANALAARCRVSVAVPPDAECVGALSNDVHSVRVLEPGSRRNPLVLRQLARVIREERADVVHTHAAKATEMVYWVSRFVPLTHVATKHNTRGRRVFSWVRHVTAVSAAAKASIDRTEGVTVVYNGVAVSAPTTGVKPELFTILAVGRLHTHKGFDVLIREVARLPFPCALEIAGEGPERSSLDALIRKLGLEDGVTLLGHRKDVAELMARAHVLVVSSRTEGFSLALVEGLHCCDVVLSTRVGIAEEVLPEELLIDFGSIAERVSDVRSRYQEYVDLTGRVRADVSDRFLLSRMTDEYLAVYDRAVGA